MHDAISVTFPEPMIFLLSVDCVWEWLQWGPCNATCGGGTRPRNRTVTRPAAHGGAACPVYLTGSGVCKTQGCPGEAYVFIYLWLKL